MWFHCGRPRHTSSDAVRPAVGQLVRLSVSLKLICTVEQNNLQSRPVPQSQIYGWSPYRLPLPLPPPPAPALRPQSALAVCFKLRGQVLWLQQRFLFLVVFNAPQPRDISRNSVNSICNALPPPSPRVPHHTGPSSGGCQLVVATSSGHVFCSIQRWLVIDKVKKIQFYLLQYFIITGQIGICAVRATDHRLLETYAYTASHCTGEQW